MTPYWTWRRATALVIVGVAVLSVLYDLVAYNFGGSAATVSRTLLDAGAGVAGFALCVVFAMGVLVGHVFLSQTVYVTKEPADGGETMDSSRGGRPDGDRYGVIGLEGTAAVPPLREPPDGGRGGDHAPV